MVRAVAVRRGQLVIAEVDHGVTREHPHFLDADMPHRAQALRGEFLTGETECITRGILGIRHVGGQHRADDLAPFLAGVGATGDVEVLFREEQLQDLGIAAVTEGAQECGCRELLLLVDVHVDDIVDVDRELDP